MDTATESRLDAVVLNVIKETVRLGGPITGTSSRPVMVQELAERLRLSIWDIVSSVFRLAKRGLIYVQVDAGNLVYIGTGPPAITLPVPGPGLASADEPVRSPSGPPPALADPARKAPKSGRKPRAPAQTQPPGRRTPRLSMRQKLLRLGAAWSMSYQASLATGDYAGMRCYRGSLRVFLAHEFKLTKAAAENLAELLEALGAFVLLKKGPAPMYLVAPPRPVTMRDYERVTRKSAAAYREAAARQTTRRHASGAHLPWARYAAAKRDACNGRAARASELLDANPGLSPDAAIALLQDKLGLSRRTITRLIPGPAVRQRETKTASRLSLVWGALVSAADSRGWSDQSPVAVVMPELDLCDSTARRYVHTLRRAGSLTGDHQGYQLYLSRGPKGAQ